MGSLRSLRTSLIRQQYTYKFLCKDQHVGTYWRILNKMSFVIQYYPTESILGFTVGQLYDTIPRSMWGKHPSYRAIQALTFLESKELIEAWYKDLCKGRKQWYQVIDWPEAWTAAYYKNGPKLSEDQVLLLSTGERIYYNGFIFPI